MQCKAKDGWINTVVCSMTYSYYGLANAEMATHVVEASFLMSRSPGEKMVGMPRRTGFLVIDDMSDNFLGSKNSNNHHA
eukprot:scaffold12163_cov176-Amphora_coffeaeformis.AAC.12